VSTKPLRTALKSSTTVFHKTTLRQVSSIASEGVTGCLQGIKSIAALMAFVDWEEAGTDYIQDVAYAIAGLADIGQDVNDKAQWFDMALRATSD
jgi:phosphoglycerate dehydrogenase-like enzyme